MTEETWEVYLARFVKWRDGTLTVATEVGCMLQKRNQEYRKALQSEIHNNPVDKVSSFLNFTAQGFFKNVFGHQPTLTEEDVMEC